MGRGKNWSSGEIQAIIEAFIHAGVSNDVRVNLEWISAEAVADDGPGPHLSRVDGILIPGGFGERGSAGKIAAVRFARESRIPYFGICLGLQTAIIEFARNVCRLEDSNSSEFAPECGSPVISLMSDQRDVENIGGTMRLGG